MIMYFQFLIEDASTEILVSHIMKKLQNEYQDKEIEFNIKSFSGIGHLRKNGDLMERKGGNLLNNLYRFLRGFDKVLCNMKDSAIIVVVDNDRRDFLTFRKELEQIIKESVMCTDCVCCIAVKEMEAWILGDERAVAAAYPQVKKKIMISYRQDEICDTWQVLANAVYPGGLAGLYKKAKNSYSEIGKAKCEWAENIGAKMTLETNKSPSFQYFLQQLKRRIEA